MADWETFFVVIAVLCAVLTLLALGQICNTRQGKKDIEEYLEFVDFVQNKWGQEMPFTYPRVGPDPRIVAGRPPPSSVGI